jgi:hypothetical protein
MILIQVVKQHHDTPQKYLSMVGDKQFSDALTQVPHLLLEMK